MKKMSLSWVIAMVMRLHRKMGEHMEWQRDAEPEDRSKKAVGTSGKKEEQLHWPQAQRISNFFTKNLPHFVFCVVKAKKKQTANFNLNSNHAEILASLVTARCVACFSLWGALCDPCWTVCSWAPTVSSMTVTWVTYCSPVIWSSVTSPLSFTFLLRHHGEEKEGEASKLSGITGCKRTDALCG